MMHSPASSHLEVDQLTFGDFSDDPHLTALIQNSRSGTSAVSFYRGSVAAVILQKAAAQSANNGQSNGDSEVDDVTVKMTECRVKDTPFKDTPVKDIPVKDSSAKDTPIKDNPVKDSSVKDTTVKDTTVKDTPVKDTPPKSWSGLFPAGGSGAPVYELPDTPEPADTHCFRPIVSSLEPDHRARASVPPRGFINRNNTCYVNSVLQVLFLCPPVSAVLRALNAAASKLPLSTLPPVLSSLLQLQSDISSRETQDFNVKQQQEVEALLQSCAPLDPLPVIRMLEQVPGHSLRLGVQEDAEEFLSFLLSALHEELAGLSAATEGVVSNGVNEDAEDDEDWAQVGRKNRPVVTRNHGKLSASVITRLVGGRLRSVLSTSHGKRQSDSLQPFLVLPLCIDQDIVHTLGEALKLWNQAERVEEKSLKKQLFLDSLPQLLLVQLKCFVFDTSGPAKILKRLEVPGDLEIPQSLLSGEARSSVPQMCRRYRLYGVIHHWGRVIGKGHYTATVYHNVLRRWLLLDDKLVRVSSMEEVLSCREGQGCMPYLLFYRRQDTLTSNMNIEGNKAANY